MAALRIRPATASVSIPFCFSALCTAFAPTSIGYQDLKALLARQPGVSHRWREHLIASPFGTIDAATFSFSRPIGTSMPEPLVAQPVNFDPRALDVKIWIGNEPLPALSRPDIAYPRVNRSLKGDRLAAPQTPAGSGSAGPERALSPQPLDAPAPPTVNAPSQPVSSQRPKDAAAAPEIAAPAAQPNVVADAPMPPAPASSAPSAAPSATTAVNTRSAVLTRDPHHEAAAPDDEDDFAIIDKPPEIPDAEEGEPLESPSTSLAAHIFEDEPADPRAQLYFGVAAMGTPGGLQQWAPGAAPVLAPSAPDSNIKLSALMPPGETPTTGSSVASKDDGGRLESPAERLGLSGKPRAKAEKCLADAVYFEARGEPMRGQEAVAQVVMNRVFSGYYPHDVCGVVYQNASRYLACQFTFACEHRDLSRIDEPDMWEQAKRIAKDTLDGKIWLAQVGHATHYHAYWVHPSWVREMTKLYKLGVHTFYRPRAWGDGSDAPTWGAGPSTPNATDPGAGNAEKPDAAMSPAASPGAAEIKAPEASAAPIAPAQSGAANNATTADL